MDISTYNGHFKRNSFNIKLITKRIKDDTTVHNTHFQLILLS